MIAEMKEKPEVKEKSEVKEKAEMEKQKGSQEVWRGADMRNEMELTFDAVSNNESFARVAVAAFVSHLNPTLEELADIKTAVSEAVTNSIIHGYENLYGYGRHGEVRPSYETVHPGKVRIRCLLEKGIFILRLRIRGRGFRILKELWSPCLPQNRSWNAREWVLPLWRLLWTIWRFPACRDREPVCG